MRYIVFLFLLLYSCNSDFKKYQDVGKFRLYELQCNNKYYLSLENCNCKNLPKNYFVPIGDTNDHFFSIYIKESNDKLQVNSLYEGFKTYGVVKDKVDFIIYTDNSRFIDNIKKENYKILQGYSNGTMTP
ncbi:hypothetical protein ACTS95_09285 [Empedobacter brevis]|uniref:hypothetical protein n=1 Tax=Empedobacter brevis TaxID=247 RepID=UPI0028A8E40B|nr:hypothetical protein [Empedobacter brevis]